MKATHSAEANPSPTSAAGFSPRAIVTGLVILAVAWIISAPFWVVQTPPIVDLPFHASQTSILAHYFDPAWGFREQFTLHPIEVPYLTMYGLGALFAQVFPIEWAVKAMAIAMLALPPLGLAVLFAGMRKSPLLGLLGTAFTWTNLTHWGFLNFYGAIGLYAACIGFTLMTLDRPTRVRQLGVTLTLIAIFFTHLYRLPFALLSVLVTIAVLYPATRRIRPALEPLLPPVVLFALWRMVRGEELGMDLGELTFDLSRLGEFDEHLFDTFLAESGEVEAHLALRILTTTLAFGVACTALFFVQGRARGRATEERAWGIGVTVLPVLLASGFLLTYLTLPLQIGQWFYVYPRELTTTLFVLLAVIPDLPRNVALQAPLLLVAALGPGQMTRFIRAQWRHFDTITEDYRRIAPLIPKRPRLMYLVYERRGTHHHRSPFLHYPAWIQATRGGALSFHFIAWNHSPIRYRTDSPQVPPPTPERWEWEPQHFRANIHGPWFDTFLIRHPGDPSKLFADSPDIRVVAHEGTWWLYRRDVAQSP